MKMKTSRFFAGLIILFIPVTIAAQGDKPVQFIENSAPKYVNEEFISLEELYSIDVDEFDKYYIYQVMSMDVDDDLNLYVLDYFEATITVFDKNGKYIRSMAGKGQGPRELERPIGFSIYADKIYIHENHKGVKILNLLGEYVDFNIPQRPGNYKVIEAFDDFFLTVNMTSNQRIDPRQRNYIIEKHSNDLQEVSQIWNITYQGDHNMLIFHDYYIAIDSKRNIYVPEDHETYKINKITLDGELVLSFGREYKRVPYSKKISEIHKKVFDNAPIAIASSPVYPPVVRYILIDDYDYIWIVAGEWQGDAFGDNGQGMRVETTVDIFNENGEFLFTFKTPFLGFRSFIKNGRLYLNPTEDDLNIRVFKINYNK